MSTNIFFDAQALNPGVKIVAGTFKPNGTSAIDNTVNKGAGWTVARTAVGKFIVTLDSVYPGLLSAQVSLQHNGAGDKKFTGVLLILQRKRWKYSVSLPLVLQI